MKKIIALLLISMMLMGTLFANAEMSVAGGWTVADSTGITVEHRAVFDKAMKDLLGVNYEPIAYLATQVVAGQNHCFLCKATVVYPNAAPELVLVYIYEDLSGSAEITNIAPLDIAAMSSPAVPAR